MFKQAHALDTNGTPVQQFRASAMWFGWILYVDELQQIGSRVDLYNGFEQPPAEDEYREIVTPLVHRDGLTERYYYEESDEEYDSEIEEWYIIPHLLFVEVRSI